MAVDASDTYGEFLPNPWGFWQMHGNVEEWCRDWHDDAYYDVSPEEDPEGPRSAIFRAVRGGSWEEV